MASKRASILTAIREALLGIETLSSEQVLIGAIPTIRVNDAPGVTITWESDRGRRIDGDAKRRTLSIMVGCIMIVDRVADEAEVLQVDDVYDEVHAKLEELSVSKVGGLVINFEEDTDGIGVESLDDGDNVVAIGSRWVAEYDVTIATTGEE